MCYISGSQNRNVSREAVVRDRVGEIAPQGDGNDDSHPSCLSLEAALDATHDWEDLALEVSLSLCRACYPEGRSEWGWNCEWSLKECLDVAAVVVASTTKMRSYNAFNAPTRRLSSLMMLIRFHFSARLLHDKRRISATIPLSSTDASFVLLMFP